jgi:thioredoxin reductase
MRDSSFRVGLNREISITSGQVVLATGVRFKSGGFKSAINVAIGPGKPTEAIDVYDRRVAILGGGDNAFEHYHFTLARGATLCRVFGRTIRAQRKLRESVPPSNVIQGDFFADQNRMTVNGEAFDAFLVQFGYEPVLPACIPNVQLDPNGFVLADRWGVTTVDGFYAVGEVTQTFHPCVTTSSAHGIQAAKVIQRRLGA